MSANALELFQYMSYPALLDHLSDDIEYHLPNSLWDGVRGVHTGRAAVETVLSKIMTEFYGPVSSEVEIIAEFGAGQFATRLFKVAATTKWGETHKNDYAITIEAADGKIVRIFEYLDSKQIYDTLDNSKLR